MESKTFRRLALYLWMMFIFILSAVPGKNVPNPFPLFHLCVHIAEYSVLAFLFARAWQGLSAGKLIFWTLVFTALFAASDEWHQSFTPGRASEWQMAVKDTLFGLAGIAAFFLLHKPRS